MFPLLLLILCPRARPPANTFSLSIQHVLCSMIDIAPFTLNIFSLLQFPSCMITTTTIFELPLLSVIGGKFAAEEKDETKRKKVKKTRKRSGKMKKKKERSGKSEEKQETNRENEEKEETKREKVNK